MKNVQAVVLAGGLGTRMAEGKPSAIPKALMKLAGRPMVSYILETLRNIETKKQKNIKMGKPIVVIGPYLDLFQKEFANNCQYVIQKEPLGTGQAAKLGINHIRVNPRHISASIRVQDVFILQGDDSAFYQPRTLEKFIQNHESTKAVLSFLTTKITNPSEFGRVIRDKRGRLINLVEKEHLTPKQEKIKEINCGGYLINLLWAKKNIGKIKRTLKRGKEYPLPDIIKIALRQGRRVNAFPINSSEWFGINSPEQLKEAEQQIKIQNSKH